MIAYLIIECCPKSLYSGGGAGIPLLPGDVEFAHAHMIPNVAGMARPLHHLTRKGVAFEWTPEYHHAFAMSKELLASETVIAKPNRGKTFTEQVKFDQHVSRLARYRLHKEVCLNRRRTASVPAAVVHYIIQWPWRVSLLCLQSADKPGRSCLPR